MSWLSENRLTTALMDTTTNVGDGVRGAHGDGNDKGAVANLMICNAACCYRENLSINHSLPRPLHSSQAKHRSNEKETESPQIRTLHPSTPGNT